MKLTLIPVVLRYTRRDLPERLDVYFLDENGDDVEVIGEGPSRQWFVDEDPPPSTERFDD